MRKLSRVVAPLFVPLFLNACDSAGPAETTGVDFSPEFQFLTPAQPIDPAAIPDPSDVEAFNLFVGETLIICKTGSAGTFDVTDGSTTETRTYTVPEDECLRVVDRSFLGATYTVDEVATPAGFELGQVDKWQTLCGLGQAFCGGAPQVVETLDVGDPASGFVGGSASAEGVAGLLLRYTNVPSPTDGGGEACTPGFWKQEHHFDSWPGGTSQPQDDIETVFDIPAALTLQNPERGTDPEDLTLLAALELRGGGVNALLRHAVAAWLNAGAVDYPLSQAEVVTLVNAALAGGDVEAAKATLAGFNEDLLCPLN